jgi:4-aminobutyrate aminotransferase-like enzyme
MATQEFPLSPRDVGLIETTHRRIRTKIPVPESVPILEELRRAEPRSMGGQPPVVWAGGDRCTIRDPWGNRWIDLCAGVLVAACGHGHPRITRAICEMAAQGLHHAYCFPTEVRARLAAHVKRLLPPPLARVFLLTTGSESAECAIKLARTMGLKRGNERKRVLVTFENAFHGRTMGAQRAGGSPALKSWLGGAADPDFVQAPFPDGYRCEDTSFALFENSLARSGVEPGNVCGVMFETYQGCNATPMPAHYAQALRRWCDRHQALLICDEIQAGFGRCGTWFGFERLGIVPDVACFGKGISGGMPLAACAGTEEVMSLYGPGEMTSTHSANPICAAAALANLEVIEEEKLVENSARLSPILLDACRAMQDVSGGRLGRAAGVGLVAALQFARPGTKDPDPALAWRVVKKAYERGLMLFAPVGVGGAAVKIAPPLTTNEECLREGLEVLAEIVREECEG